MQFLTNEDLETRLFEDFIDDSVQEDLDALDNIEKHGIATIKSKLRQRYDVAVMFTDAEYEGRDLIVNALSAIVTYRMIRRNAARKVPDDFARDYTEQMTWLNSVRDGIEEPGFPVPEITERKEVYWGVSKNEDLYI